MIYFLLKVSVLFAFAKRKILLAANNFVKKAYDNDFSINTCRKRYTSTIMQLPSDEYYHFSKYIFKEIFLFTNFIVHLINVYSAIYKQRLFSKNYTYLKREMKLIMHLF